MSDEVNRLLPLAKPVEGVSGKTGTWRVVKPVFVNDKCIRCMLCWLYCPEGVIEVVDREDAFITINYDYCKGCGICSDVCPVKAIELIPEGG